MDYSEDEKKEIFNEICSLISAGTATRKAIKAIGISSSTFYDWIDSYETMAKQYARACDDRTVMKFESIEEDYMETPQRDPETGRIDPAWVNLQRLKIDSKKWELSKLMPKKYGDKLDIDHTTQGEKITSVDLSVIPTDILEKMVSNENTDNTRAS